MDVEFHPQALAEYDGAVERYSLSDVRAASRFIERVETAVRRIAEAPDRWPSHLHGTRRIALRKFPYSIIYLAQRKPPLVIAVAHQHRPPGYWATRLP